MVSKAQYAEARLEYESDPGMTYRELGERLGVSPQAVQKRAKSEGWQKPDDDLAQVVEQLPTAQPTQGSALGIRSPENILKIINTYAKTGNKTLASGVVGITPDTLRNWCKEDHELLALMSVRRKEFLVNQYGKIAEARDWKSGAEILSRAPETREEWGAQEQKGPTIVLNILRE